MKETAYGKINLGLSVLGRRPDGYHQVDMIMQSISLADSITFVPAEAFGVETDNPQLPCDGSNLMVKAARAFAERTGQPVPYRLVCAKRQPDWQEAVRMQRRSCGASMPWPDIPWIWRNWKKWELPWAAISPSVYGEGPSGLGDGEKK